MVWEWSGPRNENTHFCSLRPGLELLLGGRIAIITNEMPAPRQFPDHYQRIPRQCPNHSQTTLGGQPSSPKPRFCKCSNFEFEAQTIPRPFPNHSQTTLGGQPSSPKPRFCKCSNFEFEAQTIPRPFLDHS